MTHSLDDALVEKVARAIAGVCFETGWDDLAEGTRACFFPYARAALEAAGVAELREEKERLRETLEEATRRYPDARAALAWFSAASGLAAGEITQEVLDWALAALTNQGKAQG